MRPIVKNSTNQSVVIRIIDSEDGTPENGVVWNTAGIDLWYRREGAVKVSITEATLATLDAAHSDGGFLLIGDGYYRLDLPDAAVATGANGVMVGGTVTGMIVIGCYVPLVDYDPYDSVRAGLTALPPAAADAAGGLPISDGGDLDLDTKLESCNEITAERMGALTDWINGGRLDLLLDAIKAVTDALPEAGALTTIGADTARLTAARAQAIDDWINGGRLDLLLDAIKAVTDNLPNSGALTDLATAAALTTVDTVVDAIKAVTDNLPNSGALTDLATAAALAAVAGYIDTEIGTIDTVVDAIKAKTDNLPADPASETNVDANETKIDTIDTVVDAIKAKTDNLPVSPAAVGSAMGLSDDAITSAKFDESTAFPVKSADTGATQIARVGADGDTLETLSDQIDGVGGGGGDATEANQTTIINHLTDVKGGTFNSATDSLEAIRDRGDAAWITGGGGALTEILNIQPLVPNSIDLADTATVRIGLGLTNMLDDLPSTAEITPGTIKIERKAFGGTTWTTVVNDAACSELAGLVYYEEVFDSGSGYAQGDSIRVTFKNQKITVAANDFEITGSDGWPFQTYLRDPLLTQTGVTEGGTWTLAKWLKVQIALAGGKFQDKAGVSGTYEILDPDDGTTVIAEAIPSETSPYWQITVLI